MSQACSMVEGWRESKSLKMDPRLQPVAAVLHCFIVASRALVIKAVRGLSASSVVRSIRRPGSSVGRTRRLSAGRLFTR
jgi:hypothetical protein